MNCNQFTKVVLTYLVRYFQTQLNGRFRYISEKIVKKIYSLVENFVNHLLSEGLFLLNEEKIKTFN